MQQYLGAFSLVLAETEFKEGDLDELGIYNATWDTDSKPMEIDNHASASLSDDERDFKPGTLVPVIRDVYRCGGVDRNQRVWMGTMLFTFLDNNGQRHTHELKE